MAAVIWLKDGDVASRVDPTVHAYQYGTQIRLELRHPSDNLPVGGYVLYQRHVWIVTRAQGGVLHLFKAHWDRITKELIDLLYQEVSISRK